MISINGFRRLRGVALQAAALTAAVIVLAGCASSYTTTQRILRPATDVPKRFVPEGKGAEVNRGMAGGTCYSPMLDPRDGTKLMLHRSAAGEGDYEVPVGRYGVAEGELLRLDCRTGTAVGIVPR